MNGRLENLLWSRLYYNDAERDIDQSPVFCPLLCVLVSHLTSQLCNFPVMQKLCY